MLAYSNHCQGFFSVYPSANALNTMVGFMHQRYFPIVRRIFIGESYNCCLGVGKTHPFLLVGTSDGSLWCMNPQVELFSTKRGLTDRLRLFQHEHRPRELFPADAPAGARGASRIIHGFAVEKGRSPKGEIKAQQGKKAKRPKKADLEAGEGIEDDEAGGLMDPTRGIVYEPLSRVVVVEWNPNDGFGCWAAAAMASGLVRVMDLGLDNATG
jgi:transcription factor C subunit 6